jgi:hypothetical protein
MIKKYAYMDVKHKRSRLSTSNTDQYWYMLQNYEK